MNEKRPLTFNLFLLRLLSGIAGGVIGTLAVFLVYFIMHALVSSEGEVTSISAFVIIVMGFVGTLTANTLTATMVTFIDNDKYSRRKTIITHIFLFNLILFFLTIPFYLMGISLEIVNGIAALHFLLSAFVSALIMEIIAGHEYSLLGVYSTALGIFMSIGLAFMLSMLKIEPQFFIFAAMPTVWFMLQVTGGMTELIYDNFIRLYGIDALNVSTDLGGDEEVESDDVEQDEGDDES